MTALSPPLQSGLGLTGALGVNLWVLAEVVPIAFAPSGRRASLLLLPIAPLLLLHGLRRRSAPALLLGLPIAALAPLALPEFEAARQNPFGFVIVAASLLAFVVAALRTLERTARAGPSAQAPPRELAETLVTPRWTRRLRIYRGLAAAAALLPALLIYAIALHQPTAASLAASFPGAVESAQAMMITLAGLLSAVVFARWLVRPLVSHLEHDVAVRVRLEESRLLAQRGRPRGTFYLAVALALALMATVIALHTGAGS